MEYTKNSVKTQPIIAVKFSGGKWIKLLKCCHSEGPVPGVTPWGSANRHVTEHFEILRTQFYDLYGQTRSTPWKNRTFTLLEIEVGRHHCALSAVHTDRAVYGLLSAPTLIMFSNQGMAISLHIPVSELSCVGRGLGIGRPHVQYVQYL
jgi:hypothetical protein